MSDSITMDEINAALLPVSRAHGYCLCIHPMMELINFSGTSCVWCLQPVTDAAWGPEAKAIRTEAVRTAYPEKLAHLSLLCKLRQDEPHPPCSGTCDGHGSGNPCDQRCSCRCHGE